MVSDPLMSRTPNRSLTIFVAVLALTASGAGSSGVRGQASRNEFLVTEGKAGPIEIGMPIDDLAHRFGRERIRLIDQAKEGHFSPAIAVDIPGASIAAPIIAECSTGFCGGGGF